MRNYRANYLLSLFQQFFLFSLDPLIEPFVHLLTVVLQAFLRLLQSHQGTSYFLQTFQAFGFKRQMQIENPLLLRFQQIQAGLLHIFIELLVNGLGVIAVVFVLARCLLQ